MIAWPLPRYHSHHVSRLRGVYGKVKGALQRPEPGTEQSDEKCIKENDSRAVGLYNGRSGRFQ